MSSEADNESSLPVSRDESFFSLSSPTTANNSLYFTAAESLTAENRKHGVEKESHDGDDQIDPDKNNSESGSASLNNGDNWSSAGSSMTLAEAESLQSYSVSEEEYDADNGSISSENGVIKVKVKEDVSKICNDIAETVELDVKKKESILLATNDSFEELRALAVSEGGLLTNSLRKKAWPLLLNISKKEIKRKEHKHLSKKFPMVEEQIQNLVTLDVARVLKRFPPGLSDPQQDHLQTHLTNLICSCLERNPSAHYYQGFHDISLTFLLVCMSESAPYLSYLCVNRMVETCLAPYMEKTMDTTHELIHVIFALIEKEDEELYKKIVIDSKCPVAFSLAWVLTWFSHTLPHDTDVFRLYDFILGSMHIVTPSCLAPVFISAALVLRNSELIKESVTETDIAPMHMALSDLSKKLTSLEPWLADSLQLMKKYSGREETLIKRAVEIKDMQNELWNEDTNNNRNRNRQPRNTNIIVSIGKFLFVKHRWMTMAIVALGAAYLIQARYGSRNSLHALRVAVKKFTPRSLKWAVKGLVHDDDRDK